MENPLKIRRLSRNYTIDQLATEAGVTHDHIIRNEQGLFNKPSPKVLSAILRLSGDRPEDVVLEYRNWISWKRRQEPIRSLVKRNITFDRPERLTQHPFLLWRTAIAPGTSRIEFCKMLAVHPSTLLKYETGQQRPMPSQIYDALIECGMTKDKVEALAKLGIQYFDHQKYFRRSKAARINS